MTSADARATSSYSHKLACDRVFEATTPAEALGLGSLPANERTEATIHRAFRKASLLVHPDKNDDPRAEQAFKLLGHCETALLAMPNSDGALSGCSTTRTNNSRAWSNANGGAPNEDPPPATKAPPALVLPFRIGPYT
eukprot:SAG31_NODE_9158_length_1324_cov_1.375510_2_plen_137_part_01